MTKLEKIMKNLGTSQMELYRQIKINVSGTDEAPLGIPSINKIVKGTQKWAHRETFEKILNALNDIRNIRNQYSRQFLLKDIVDDTGTIIHVGNNQKKNTEEN